MKDKMRNLLRLLHGEGGHVGAVTASLFAIAGMVLLPIGLVADIDALSIAGAVLLGLGIITAVNAPHIWVGRIYGRLDRVAPDDPDARTDDSIRLEF